MKGNKSRKYKTRNPEQVECRKRKAAQAKREREEAFRKYTEEEKKGDWKENCRRRRNDVEERCRFGFRFSVFEGVLSI